MKNSDRTFGERTLWILGCMGFVGGAGCQSDQLEPNDQASTDWGVEAYGTNPVGSNNEDPNQGWDCGLDRCPSRLGEPAIARQTGTCIERGYVVGDDGRGDTKWSRDLVFDARGRLASVDGDVYRYDGDLLVEITGDGYSTSFDYNDANKLTARTSYEDSVQAERVEWEYDAQWRLTRRVATEDGEVHADYYTYPDPLVRLMSYEPGGDDWFLREDFAEDGRRMRIEYNNEAYGPAHVYEYDEDGIITALRPEEGERASPYEFEYGVDGRIARVNYLVGDGFEDHGVITREGDLTTLEVFTTRSGTDAPEFVYELEGDSCERAAVGPGGWLNLTRLAILHACGPSPCTADRR